jgi:tRNA (guanine-N7-)-methyltransferase
VNRPYYRSLGPLILWKRAERPYPWAARFGRTAPLELEIGFGNGDSLVARALAEPEKDFIGVEICWESMKRALRRASKAGATNVAVVQGPARALLDRLLTPRSLAAATCLFPCPWPKERHARHRLFSREFLRVLNSRLEDGGEARIVTDFPAYAEWLLGEVPGTGFDATREEIPPTYDTKYERKWSERGQDRFVRLILAKREHVPVPLREDVPMNIHTVERFDPDRFEPTGLAGDLTVQFKETLFDARRRKAMIRVFVAEEGLQQEFWIEVFETAGGWKIRPAEGSGAVPTAGAQAALDLVRDAATAAC